MADSCCESCRQSCLPAESRPARSFQSYITALLGSVSRKQIRRSGGFIDRSSAYRSPTVAEDTLQLFLFDFAKTSMLVNKSDGRQSGYWCKPAENEIDYLEVVNFRAILSTISPSAAAAMTCSSLMLPRLGSIGSL